MNKALQLWKVVFGPFAVPLDQEIIGVEADGTVLYYNAKDGSCYSDGLTVDAVNDREVKMNEREHIVTHPLQYVVLLRHHLFKCLSPGTARPTKKHLNDINAIVAKATSDNPHAYVSNLQKEAEYIGMKKDALPEG